MAESCSTTVSCNIASVAVVAVVERKAMKSKYAFDIVTEWSDGNKTNCYRSYQEFFTFHCQILDRFPDEAGATPASKRSIPFLPGKKIFRRSTKGLAEERLPQLDQYMKELMNLSEKVTDCVLVKQFVDRNYKEISEEVSPASNEAQDETSEATKSLQAVKIAKESGVVSYSPVIRSNANPIQLTEDDHQGHHKSNPQAVNNPNSDSQSNISIPIDSRVEKSSDNEGHVGSDIIEPTDKEIDHDSVVIEETNKDPSQGQHEGSVGEVDSEEETAVVDEPVETSLHKNEMEGNAEDESKQSLAQQQLGEENSNKADKDIAISKDEKGSDTSQLHDEEKFAKVDSSVANE